MEWRQLGDDAAARRETGLSQKRLSVLLFVQVSH